MIENSSDFKITKLPEIHKNYSKNIRKYLSQKYKEKQTHDLENYFITYSYFDIFVVHNDELYALTLKTELFEKLINDYGSAQNEYILKEIVNLLKIGDFGVLPNKIKNYIYLTREASQDYQDLYYHFGKFFEQISQVIITEEDHNSNMFNSIKPSFQKSFNYIKSTFDILKDKNKETNEIMNLLSGNHNPYFNMLFSNINQNLHQVISLYICLNFYWDDYNIRLNNFISKLVKLNNLSHHSKEILYLILYRRNPDLLVEVLKRNQVLHSPLLDFTMFDICFQMDLLKNESDTFTLFTNECNYLLSSFIQNEIDFKYFAIYYKEYPKVDVSSFDFFKHYAIKCIEREFEFYQANNDANSNRKILKEAIDDIIKRVREVISTSKGMKRINEIIFWKYLEIGMIVEAIECYVNIITMQQKKVGGNEKLRVKFNLSETAFLLQDELFIEIIRIIHNSTLKNGIKDIGNVKGKLIEIFQYCNVKNKGIQQLIFISNYIGFILLLNDIKMNKIDEISLRKFKQVFEVFFVQMECPLFIWVECFIIYKEVSDNQEYLKLKYEEYEKVYFNYSLYEGEIKKNMNKYSIDKDNDMKIAEIKRIFKEISLCFTSQDYINEDVNMISAA